MRGFAPGSRRKPPQYMDRAGRFEKSGRGDRAWVVRLADAFTLDELLAQAGAGNEQAALTWLYAAVERGSVVPQDGPDRPLLYRFAGSERRRAEPGAAGGELATSG
jgi:hypothetical protein